MATYRPAAAAAACLALACCGPTASAFSISRPPQGIFPATGSRTSRHGPGALHVASREQTEVGISGNVNNGVPAAIRRHLHLPLVPTPRRAAAGTGTAADSVREITIGEGEYDDEEELAPQHAQHAQHGHEHHEHLAEDAADDADTDDDDDESQFDMIIGPGSALSLGTDSALTFPRTLLVRGTVAGRVECANNSNSNSNGNETPPESTGVRVSSGGTIEGDVGGLGLDVVEVAGGGRIVGDVTCACLRIDEGGEIVGDVECGSLFLEPGASVRGIIRCGGTSEEVVANQPALGPAADASSTEDSEGVNANGGATGAAATVEVDPAAEIYEIEHLVANGYQANNGYHANGHTLQNNGQHVNGHHVNNGQAANIGHHQIVNGQGVNGHQANGHVVHNGHQANGHQANGHQIYNGAQQQQQPKEIHPLTHSSAATLEAPKVNGWGALPPVTATRSMSKAASPTTQSVPNFQPQFPYDPSGSKHISIRNGLGMDIGESASGSSSSTAASVSDGIFGYLGNPAPKSNGVVVEKEAAPTTDLISHRVVEPLPTTVSREDMHVPRVLDKNGKISTQGTLDAIREQYQKESENPFYLDDFGNPLYRGANEDEMTTLRNNRQLVDENRRLIEDYLRSKQEKAKEEEEEEYEEYEEYEEDIVDTRREESDDVLYRHSEKSSGGFKKRLSVQSSDMDTNSEEDILPHFLKEDRRRRR